MQKVLIVDDSALAVKRKSVYKNQQYRQRLQVSEMSMNTQKMNLMQKKS